MRYAFYAICVAFVFWLGLALSGATRSSSGDPIPPDPVIPGPPPTAESTPAVGTAERNISSPEVAALRGRVRLEHRRYLQARHQVRRLQAVVTRRVASVVYLTQAFQCIHHYEGSWTDSGAPYYGGLQMDYGFQVTYAPQLLRAKGTADHWSPAEQIAAAIVAHATRGFEPWPNTARMCGLR
jgi:hypothetical protein